MVDFVIRHPHTSLLTTTARHTIGHVKQQHHVFNFVGERKGARDASASRALLVGKFLVS
jgi:hypothetical protein